MNYIIFDLEWNNAYCYASKKAINEIIEIGAVKLDSNFYVVDTFKQLIRPVVSKKLSSHFSKLTNITIQEIKEFGIPFAEAFKDFSSWVRGENNIFFSWSNSDLYVLQQNYMHFNGTSIIPFLTYYCDAQKYCMDFIDDDSISSAQQISLSNCAKLLSIDFDSSNLHRALTDCYLTVECLKKVYDCNTISAYTSKCDIDFFQRLTFKPYLLTEPVTQYCNIYKIDYTCPNCGNNLSIDGKFKLNNKAFSALFRCPICTNKYWGFIRVKKTYDDIKITKKFIPSSKKKNNHC